MINKIELCRNISPLFFVFILKIYLKEHAKMNLILSVKKKNYGLLF